MSRVSWPGTSGFNGDICNWRQPSISAATPLDSGEVPVDVEAIVAGEVAPQACSLHSTPVVRTGSAAPVSDLSLVAAFV